MKRNKRKGKTAVQVRFFNGPTARCGNPDHRYQDGPDERNQMDEEQGESLEQQTNMRVRRTQLSSEEEEEE